MRVGRRQPDQQGRQRLRQHMLEGRRIGSDHLDKPGSFAAAAAAASMPLPDHQPMHLAKLGGRGNRTA